MLDEAQKVFEIMSISMTNKIIDNAIAKIPPQTMVESSYI
jgi:hypothetical protein